MRVCKHMLWACVYFRVPSSVWPPWGLCCPKQMGCGRVEQQPQWINPLRQVCVYAGMLCWRVETCSYSAPHLFDRSMFVCLWVYTETGVCVWVYIPSWLLLNRLMLRTISATLCWGSDRKRIIIWRSFHPSRVLNTPHEATNINELYNDLNLWCIIELHVQCFCSILKTSKVFFYFTIRLY